MEKSQRIRVRPFSSLLISPTFPETWLFMILKLIKSRSFCNPYVTTYTNAYFLELYLSKYGIFNQVKFETYRIKQMLRKATRFFERDSNLWFPYGHFWNMIGQIKNTFSELNGLTSGETLMPHGLCHPLSDVACIGVYMHTTSNLYPFWLKLWLW